MRGRRPEHEDDVWLHDRKKRQQPEDDHDEDDDDDDDGEQEGSGCDDEVEFLGASQGSRSSSIAAAAASAPASGGMGGAGLLSQSSIGSTMSPGSSSPGEGGGGGRRVVVVRGARRDLESVLHSGRTEMLVDEVSFLSQSILEIAKSQEAHQAAAAQAGDDAAAAGAAGPAGGAADDDGTQLRGQHQQQQLQQQVEAIAELALLLAERRNRYAAFRNDNALLGSVLKVVGLAATSCFREGGPQTPRSVVIEGGPLAAAKKQGVGAERSVQEGGGAAVAAAAAAAAVATEWWKRAGRHSLAALAHFLSLDCVYVARSLAQGSASNNPAKVAAELMRKTLVRDVPMLRGIAALVACDPITASERGRGSGASSTARRSCDGSTEEGLDGGHHPERRTPPSSPARTQLRQKHTALSPTDGSRGTPVSHGSASIASSVGSGSCLGVDPTKAGRRKRRKKKKQRLDPQNVFETSAAAGSAVTNGGLEAIPELPQLERDQGGADQDKGQFTFMSDPSSARAGSPSSSNLDRQLDLLSRRVHQSLNLLMGSSRAGGGIARRSSIDSNSAAKIPHQCNDSLKGEELLTSIPLLTLNRIITGKIEGRSSASVGDEPVCMAAVGPRDVDGNANTGSEEEKDPAARDNALPEKGSFMGRAGVLPVLSEALADTLTAFVRLVGNGGCEGASNGDNTCYACIAHLAERARTLVSLVDSACLFHGENRQGFCQPFGVATGDGAIPECLILSLVSVLQKLLLEQSSRDKSVGRTFLWQGLVGEMLLETLRTLTSLTHENALAAHQLTSKRGEKTVGGGCLLVLAQILQQAVAIYSSNGETSKRRADDEEDDFHKLTYDATVFCLNTLTNVVESGASPELLVNIKLDAGDGHDDALFLPWLVDWIVDQTSGFREAIVDFGSTASASASSSYEQEDEKIVMAGNGFVLLAWLLLKDKSKRSASPQLHEEEKTTKKVVSVDDDDDDEEEEGLQGMILSKLPGDSKGDKLSFLINTLKAFCNFYHMTVGDMSVAVVAPVKALMEQLEEAFSS